MRRKPPASLTFNDFSDIKSKEQVTIFSDITSGLEIKTKDREDIKVSKGRSNTIKASYQGGNFFLKSALPDGEGTETGSLEDNFFILAKQALKEFFAIKIAKLIIPEIPESKLFVVENTNRTRSYGGLDTGETLIMVGLKEVSLGEELPIKKEIIKSVNDERIKENDQRLPILIEELESYKNLEDYEKLSLQRTLALSVIIGNNDLLNNLSLIDGEVLTTHDWGESFGFLAPSIEDDLKLNRLTLQTSNQGGFDYKPTLSIEPGVVQEVAKTILENYDNVYQECLDELRGLGFRKQTGEYESSMESRLSKVLGDFRKISKERAKGVLKTLGEIQKEKSKQLSQKTGKETEVNPKEMSAIGFQPPIVPKPPGKKTASRGGGEIRARVLLDSNHLQDLVKTKNQGRNLLRARGNPIGVIDNPVREVDNSVEEDIEDIKLNGVKKGKQPSGSELKSVKKIIELQKPLVVELQFLKLSGKNKGSQRLEEKGGRGSG